MEASKVAPNDGVPSGLRADVRVADTPSRGRAGATRAPSKRAAVKAPAGIGATLQSMPVSRLSGVRNAVCIW
jgi:hypothetical protein